MPTPPSSSPAPPEGVDGTVTSYRERVLPPWWWWVVVLALVGVLAIAYGAALDPVVGWVMFALLGGLAVVALWRWSPVVAVDDLVLRAGEARLPLRVVAAVTPLSAPAARDLRGRDADVRAFLCLRAWVPRAVRVDLDDPQDPHPYWLVSTRRPDDVVRAIAANAPGRAGTAPDTHGTPSPEAGRADEDVTR